MQTKRKIKPRSLVNKRSFNGRKDVLKDAFDKLQLHDGSHDGREQACQQCRRQKKTDAWSFTRKSLF